MSLSLVDVLLAIAAGAANCGALWEQDIWWQIRLGEEVLSGHFPSTEEWSYTAVGKPFHNHWWLASVILSLIYHLGGVFALTLARGLVTALVVWLLCQLHPRSSRRWPMAAVGYVVSLHRLQVRPESLCFVLFVLLFLLARRLGERRAADPALAQVWWPREVLLMYACVALAANTHFGVVPWVLFAALVLLADGVFDASPSSVRIPLLGLTIDVACVCRALPAVLAVCLSPQPMDGVRYILHHAPGNMNVHDSSENPEHQSLMTDWNKAFYGPGSSRSTGGRWLAVYVALSALAPAVWAFLPAGRRPHGLRQPLIVLGAHGVLLALSVDRSRNLVYSAYFALAMLGAGPEDDTGSQAKKQPKDDTSKQGKNKQQPAKGKRSAASAASSSSSSLPGWLSFQSAGAGVALLVGAGLVWLSWEWPALGVMTMHNWPVRSTNFVNEHRPKGNVFHGPTSGGWLAYWLHRDYPVMTDTRQYCFAHFEQEYQLTQRDNQWLLQWTEKYNVNTMIIKIPTARQMGPDVLVSPSDPLVQEHGWARVFFDHFSEVLVKRIPEHEQLIETYEIKMLDPSKAPDYYARIINTGRVNQAWAQQLEDEVKTCMSRPHPEMYCRLVKICLRVSRDQQKTTLIKALNALDGVPCPTLVRGERSLVRTFTESLKVHLRTQLGMPTDVNRCAT